MYLHRETFPNQSFHQIIDIVMSSRAVKQKWETLQKLSKPTAPSVPRRSPIQVLNFSDRRRTGVINVIWPLARVHENVDNFFEQHTYTF